MENQGVLVDVSKLTELPTRATYTGETAVDITKDVLFMPITIVERADKVNRFSHAKYHPYLFGILPDGQKACVIMKDAEVYCDVLVPTKYDGPTFQSFLKTKLVDHRYNFTKVAIEYGYKLKGFQTEKSPWCRVYFNNIADRKEVLEMLHSEKYETASDDDNNYFALLARRYRFNTCSWNRLAAGKYSVSTSPMVTNLSMALEVSINDFEGLDEKVIQDLSVGIPTLIKDRTMVMAWDIETYTCGVQTGDAPRPEDDNYEIFMICMVFSWQYSDVPLARICILNRKTLVHRAMTRKSDYTIMCPDEKAVLKAFGDVARRFRPDISVAFNGGGFDWPVVREKAFKHGVLKHIKDGFSCIVGPSNETDKGIHRWNFREEKVKISAEEPKFKMLCAQFPGLLDTDCMVVFKQLYPTAEVGKGFSLNFYLKMNKLEGKEDMAYKRMFRIYEMSAVVDNCTCGQGDGSKLCDVRKHIEGYYREGLTEKPAWFDAEYLSKYKGKACRDIILEEMSLVCYYCVVDAYRCQQLYVVRSIIDDKRELSNMSYVSLYDSFYRANGMKVRNLIAKYCHENGVMFSNAKVDNEKIKYPGAWVFPPKKGLNNKRPTTALDFSSLYPSLMMAYNLSPDKSIVRIDDRRNGKTEEGRARIEAMDKYAATLREKGYELHHVKFHCAEANVDVEGWTVRHRGNHDINHDGKKIMVDWQKEADGSLKKDAKGNCIPTHGRECLPGESMGIFPYILKKLFDRRAALKVGFNALGKLKEKCETEMKKPENRDGDTVLYARFLTTEDIKNTGYADVSQVDYADVCFRRNKVDSKQKAMKVHMNTFYGESGNFLSAIYELMVAGGITTAGQYNIKKVSQYLTNHKYDVRYGDTDSNYLCCPDEMFEEVDKIFQRQLTEIIRLESLYPDQTDATEVKRHRAEITKLYDSVDKDYADRIKSKKCSRFDYYRSEDGWTLARAYVEKTLGYPMEPATSKASAIQALRSRAREDYWIKMVQITRCDIETLRVKVNDHLADDNKTEFLKMAYEEVLFPAVFTGKKKYFGFQHLDRENFHPNNKELFIKGVDIVKQGQTELAKEWGYDFIHEICSVDNYRDIDEVIEEKLRAICSRKFETKYFIKSGKYKKPKEGMPGNVAIQSFVKRMVETRKMYEDAGDHMTAALYKIPDYGDRIFWVVVRKDHTRDLRGRKVDPKIGDKMEYVEVYEASLKTDHPMEIDMEYYLDSSIFGLFARFMSYKPEFEPPNAASIDWDDKEQYWAYDQYIVKHAKKWITEFCAQLDTREVVTDTTGKTYQNIYRTINKMAQDDLLSNIGAVAFLLYGLAWYDDKKHESNRTGVFTSKKGNQLIDRLRLQFEEFTEVGRTYGRDYLERMTQAGFTVPAIRNMYLDDRTGLKDIIITRCNAEVQRLNVEFESRLDRLEGIMEDYDHRFGVVIGDIRARKLATFEADPSLVTSLNTFPDADIEFMEETFSIVTRLLTAMQTRKQLRSICLALDERWAQLAKQALDESMATKRE